MDRYDIQVRNAKDDVIEILVNEQPSMTMRSMPSALPCLSLELWSGGPIYESVVRQSQLGSQD